MENEITVTEEKKLPSVDFKAKAVEYLNAMGNKLPAKHQAQFLELSQAFQLNPFKREIYAVGYGENWNIITGYEVYLKRAERIGKLDGWNCIVEGSGEQMTATVTIYRKDWKMPFSHTVLFSEVCQKTKDGKLNSVWAKMPSFMCKKVAIAQGFRLCFPDEFGGMPYTADEMPSEEQYKEINITPEKPKAEKKSAPLYTKEQAQEIGKILDSVDPDELPYFSAEDKDYFRVMIQTEGGEKTLSAVKEMLKAKMGA